MISKVCQITNCSFQLSGDEEKAYKYFNLPLPLLCAEERFRHLTSFVNGRKFFWRNCDATNKRIYSAFPVKTIFPVYDNQFWFSDNWDALSYGRNFSLRKTFFEQLYALWEIVPRPAYLSFETKNISAIHNCSEISQCYYVFDSCRAKQSLYSVGLFDSILCVDCLNVYSSELCYDCIDIHQSRELRWCESCINCSNSYFIANCCNCKNCLFCVNLEGKEYYIFNKRVSPEEFNKTIAAWNFTDHFQVEMAKEQFSKFVAEHLLPHLIGDKAERVSGNYIYRCNQIIDSFECVESSQLINCHNLFRAKSCIDGYGYGDDLHNAAQFVNIGSKANQIINCVDCMGDIKNLTYCSNCYQSRNLFGCVGLREKEYCIFNKQYTKSAYQELYGQIEKFLKEKDEWGRFFPPRFSGYAYNISLANEYMPLSRVQTKLFGFNWSDEAEELLKPSQILAGQNMTDHKFDEVPRGLIDFSDAGLFKKIFICEVTGMPFQITKEEVELYKRLKVAPPTRAFEQRNRERRLKIGPHKLVIRKSDDDKIKVKTAFLEEWPRAVVSFEHWKKMVRENSSL